MHQHSVQGLIASHLFNSMVADRNSLPPHSLYYYFSDMERLFDPDYIPHEQDIVHCRARTIGITETSFNLRDHEMLMVDVGGQKSERRKWIHCFQDVTSILFLVSLSGYDQCLVEDRDAVRKLRATLHPRPFQIGAHSAFYSESNARRDDHMGFDMSFAMVQVHVDCKWAYFHLSLDGIYVRGGLQILFLNKNDLFEKKIQHSPIKNFFPVSLGQPLRYARG